MRACVCVCVCVEIDLIILCILWIYYLLLTFDVYVCGAFSLVSFSCTKAIYSEASTRMSDVAGQVSYPAPSMSMWHSKMYDKQVLNSE